MMKTLTAIGISAAIAFAPLAAIAQTDTTAPAGAAPAASDATAPAKDSMKKSMKKHTKHMSKMKDHMAPAAGAAPANPQ
jgi:hypothetical protein